jgi:hypothetical protein
VSGVLGLIPSLKNLLQSVNRLPPEILSRIARHVPDADERDARSIIPITHVCRYWRKSIISTPENWTSIYSGSFGLAKLSLQRCKAAPLKLLLDTRKVKRNPRFSDLIKPYIQNTETLRLSHISTVEELEQTLQKFPRSIPSLRSLSLTGPRGADWDWSRDPCEPLASPLTHLSLVDIPLYRSFLRFQSLTALTLRHHRFNLHLDTLLDLLEMNRSLERATLDVRFTHPSLRNSHRQIPVKNNKLRNLSIYSGDSFDNKALVSNIAVQRGAHLEIILCDRNAGLNDIRFVISTAHLLNLRSPTFMEYWPDKRRIRLFGPNGSFSFERPPATEGPFVEFPLLPLNNIRALTLTRPAASEEPRVEPFVFSGPFGISRQTVHVPSVVPSESRVKPFVFPPLSLPALETFSIEHEINASYLLSRLFSAPSSYPSLKILAFLNCDLDDAFMAKLTRFCDNRRNTTSARLYRVVIVDSKGNIPNVCSIDMLRERVPVVDVRVGKELPSDLK